MSNVKITFDPDGPLKAVSEKVRVLGILPSAQAVVCSLFMSSDDEVAAALVISGEALEKIRPILIGEALKSHQRCEELLAQTRPQS